METGDTTYGDHLEIGNHTKLRSEYLAREETTMKSDRKPNVMRKHKGGKYAELMKFVRSKVGKRMLLSESGAVSREVPGVADGARGRKEKRPVVQL